MHTYVEYDKDKETDTNGSTPKNRFSHEFQVVPKSGQSELLKDMLGE